MIEISVQRPLVNGKLPKEKQQQYISRSNFSYFLIGLVYLVQLTIVLPVVVVGR